MKPPDISKRSFDPVPNMLAKFFIERPVFAVVISLVIVFAIFTTVALVGSSMSCVGCRFWKPAAVP